LPRRVFLLAVTTLLFSAFLAESKLEDSDAVVPEGVLLDKASSGAKTYAQQQAQAVARGVHMKDLADQDDDTEDDKDDVHTWAGEGRVATAVKQDADWAGKQQQAAQGQPATVQAPSKTVHMKELDTKQTTIKQTQIKLSSVELETKERRKKYLLRDQGKSQTVQQKVQQVPQQVVHTVQQTVPAPIVQRTAPTIPQKQIVAAGTTTIHCDNGETAKCVAGSAHCRDNDPLYCHALQQSKVKKVVVDAKWTTIHCSATGRVAQCSSGTPSCYDDSPTFCLNEASVKETATKEVSQKKEIKKKAFKSGFDAEIQLKHYQAEKQTKAAEAKSKAGEKVKKAEALVKAAKKAAKKAAEAKAKGEKAKEAKETKEAKEAKAKEAKAKKPAAPVKKQSPPPPTLKIHIRTLLVHFGVRTWLGLFGILCIFIGMWFSDRKWDEDVYASYNRALKLRDIEHAQAVEEHDRRQQDQRAAQNTGGDQRCCAPKKEAPPPMETSEAPLLGELAIPPEDLSAARSPVFTGIFLLGWLLLGVSYFFSTELQHGFDASYSVPNVLCALLCLLLGGVFASTMPSKFIYTSAGIVQRVLFLLGFLLLAVFTGFNHGSWELRNGGVSLAFSMVGVAAFCFALNVMQKHRKLGFTWEATGQPNPTPCVFNMGAPLFIFGLVLFWIGQAQTNTPDGSTVFSGMQDMLHPCEGATFCPYDNSLQVFVNYRSLLAFGSAAGIVLWGVTLDFFADQGKQAGIAGPLLLMLLWLLYGFAGFFSLDNQFSLWRDARTWVIFAICLLQGMPKSLLNSQGAFDILGVQLNMLLDVVLAVNLGMNQDYSDLCAAGRTLGLSLIAALLLAVGQWMVHRDRLMKHGERNKDRPCVYSWGLPMITSGWVCFGWAMSLNY